LSEKEFGHWWSDTASTTIPENFDYVAVRLVGYDVKDTIAGYSGI
jgi:hypothetical protein